MSFGLCAQSSFVLGTLPALAHYVVRFAKSAGLLALFVVAAGAGILSGVLFAYAGDLPEISALDNYAPSTITRIYAADGQSIGAARFRGAESDGSCRMIATDSQ